MSLLLDALKRAEQEKLTRQADRPAAPEPAVRAAAAASVLELQPIGGTQAAQAAQRADAQAAQNVFKAKAAAQAPRHRRILLSAAGVILLVVAAAGAYLWHTLSALAPRRPPLAAVRPIAPAPPAAPVAAVTPSPEEAKVAASTVPAPDAASDGDAKAPPPRSATPALDELLRQPQPAPRAPVELARSNDPRPRVAPDVEAGYRALVSGDLESAHRHYAAALASEPANVDAQLGLATVEARSGRFAEAAAAYRRTLDLDPRNPTALAGLAALADPARPEAIENALRADIARHPESAALEITLGNLLAGQGRWSEAQAAFFEAQRLQPENPDVAYNLAVSLDHLGQRRAAADFYRRALEARRTEAAQFDAAAASRRLAELSR